MYTLWTDASVFPNSSSFKLVPLPPLPSDPNLKITNKVTNDC